MGNQHLTGNPLRINMDSLQLVMDSPLNMELHMEPHTVNLPKASMDSQRLMDNHITNTDSLQPLMDSLPKVNTDSLLNKHMANHNRATLELTLHNNNTHHSSKLMDNPESLLEVQERTLALLLQLPTIPAGHHLNTLLVNKKLSL
jgi:hypothetical protein